MHHTFMHAQIPNPKFMGMAEMSTFGIFRGRNVRAETSMAEKSEHRGGGGGVDTNDWCFNPEKMSRHG